MSNTMKKITPFRGQYWFLSNMSEAPLTVDGVEYSCSEEAFQAQKVEPEKRKMFAGIGGKPAKRMGKKVLMRAECRNPIPGGGRDKYGNPLMKWEEVLDEDGSSIYAMKKVLYSKFTQNKSLAEKLLATGDAYLEESGVGDAKWGVVNGKGTNYLGILLMNLRTLLRERPELIKK